MTWFIYELEGYGTGYKYKFPKRREELKDLRFPVEAFKAACVKKGIPYPLDERPDNKSNDSAMTFTDNPDQVVIDGVTVGDIRKMCADSKPLASVLRAVVTWQNIEKENAHRKTPEALLSGLKIASRRDGWGTGKNNELAIKTQGEPLVNLITGNVRRKGRPAKDE